MDSSKTIDMAEAIAKFVPDNSTIYLAGFTHLIPFAAAHEILRKGRRGLTLCRATPDIIYDQMIAAGAAKRVVFSYAGNPGVGSLRAFRRATEESIPSPLEVEEYTHYGLSARLFAGATNMPFIPIRSNLGSDLPENNPNIRTVEDPYGGPPISVVPPLKPDVAIVHAQRSDASGNAHLWGILGEQKDAAFAAKKLILTTEEIVPEEVIRSDPNRTLIPDFIVSAVVEEPWASHPSYVQGYYDRDNDFYIQWDEISKTHEGVISFLEEWVHGVEDRRGYIAKLGAEKLMRLRPGTNFSVPVNYGVTRGEV